METAAAVEIVIPAVQSIVETVIAAQNLTQIAVNLVIPAVETVIDPDQDAAKPPVQDAAQYLQPALSTKDAAARAS